jgi:2-amino-4-hydroxy-6-hydroxymethyldihydropteridine diphosphokinase
MEKAYLLLGTNLGNKRQNLSTAISLLVTELAPYLGSGIKESSIYESEPEGFISDDNFLNQAIAFDTSLSPHDLLKVCQWVERKMGREEHSAKFADDGSRLYESRIIDIDILLYGDRKVSLPDLEIPHPRLNERKFALIPLNELL